ncbi:MAG: zinc-dependent alcohol dehydrogenase family protein [Desulfomonilaceae bacterium]
MKGMALEATRPIEERPLAMVDVETPTPGEGEVLIQVAACGVCHTDLHTVEGDLHLPMLPLIPGHQVVGRVVRTGAETSRHAIGDRVGVTWFFSSCGSCRFCLEGRQNLCEHAQFTGLHRNGGYAEYMVVPEGSAFPVPDSFSDAEATPLLCGGVIGYRALRLSGVKPGQRLGLYGFGNSAHVVIQIAIAMGCNVAVFTRSRNHQELARELGAYWVGAAGEAPPAPLDASIIFAPAGELVPTALKDLAKGGTVALAGITMTRIPGFDYDLIYGERMLRSVANTTPEDAEELLKQAEAAHVKTVVETFPLDMANEVLLMMKESRLRAGAALVME